MGKWTPDYYDDVLNAKLKSLVTGAIMRAGLETNETKISYERFVEDLDTGDSFTTSLIDCLVKEIADRNIRSRNERQGISSRTSKNLRNIIMAQQQTNPSFGVRRHRGVFGPSDFLSSEPDANSSGDELTTPAIVEGARVNSELHDALSASRTDVSYIPPSGFTTRRTSSTSHHLPSSSSIRSSSGVSLSRQASIRRPRRSRTVTDFDDFTSNRRASYRDGLLTPDESASLSTEPRRLVSSPFRRYLSRRYNELGLSLDESDQEDNSLSGPSRSRNPFSLEPDDEYINSLSGDPIIDLSSVYSSQPRLQLPRSSTSSNRESIEALIVSYPTPSSIGDENV